MKTVEEVNTYLSMDYDGDHLDINAFNDDASLYIQLSNHEIMKLLNETPSNISLEDRLKHDFPTSTISKHKRQSKKHHKIRNKHSRKKSPGCPHKYHINHHNRHHTNHHNRHHSEHVKRLTRRKSKSISTHASKPKYTRNPNVKNDHTRKKHRSIQNTIY